MEYSRDEVKKKKMLERKIDTRPRDSLGRLVPTNNAKKAINFKLKPDVFDWLKTKLSYTTYVESLVIQAKTEEEMNSSVKINYFAEKLAKVFEEFKVVEESEEWTDNLQKLLEKLRDYRVKVAINNFDSSQVFCPDCGSDKLTKDGTTLVKDEQHQRYKCKECQTKFTF
jgi:predicted RNA-binding Zn-ribbon protein involved in translation (DUF1610 family)